MMSIDQVEVEALFDARRLSGPTLLQLGQEILVEDVCVPRGNLAEMICSGLSGRPWIRRASSTQASWVG